MIALAWLASSTWVVPVLGWHHFQFGGKRQNPVTELPAATKLSGFFQEDVCKVEFAANVPFKVFTKVHVGPE